VAEVCLLFNEIEWPCIFRPIFEPWCPVLCHVVDVGAALRSLTLIILVKLQRLFQLRFFGQETLSATMAGAHLLLTSLHRFIIPRPLPAVFLARGHRAESKLVLGINNQCGTRRSVLVCSVAILYVPELTYYRMVQASFSTGKTSFEKANSQKATGSTSSPIDAFFARFSEFDYDPDKPVVSEFRRLCNHRNSLARVRFFQAFREDFKSVPKAKSTLKSFFESFPRFDYDPENDPKSEFGRLCGARNNELRTSFRVAFNEEFNKTFREMKNLSETIGCTVEEIEKRVGFLYYYNQTTMQNS
jgi:hypothetical protein